MNFNNNQKRILIGILNYPEGHYYKGYGLFKKRKDVYAHYVAHINNPLLTKPIQNPNAVCTRYAVLADDRKAFYQKCVAKGVDMDFSHCSLACPSDFALEHQMADQVLDIPFYYNLSDKELNKIIDVVNSMRLD